MNPGLFFNVLKRRSLIVWCVIAVGLGLMFALRDLVPNTYVGISHVVLVADSGTGRDPSVSIVDLPSIATSTVVLERVRNQQKLPVTLIDFKKAVAAEVLGRSSILAVSYHDVSAERAISVSNALSDELSRYYDEISTERYNVDVDRLSQEMVDETKRIRTLNEQLGLVVARNPFVTSDEAINTLSTQISALKQQRATAFAQLQGDQAAVAALAPNANSQKIARHEILADNPAYVAVQNVAATDAAQLAAFESGYTKQFPGLSGAAAKVAADNAFENQLASQVLKTPDAFSATDAANVAQRQREVAVVTGDRALVQQQDALIASENASLADFPNSGMKYNQLRAQLDALQNEYTALAQRRANALANRAEASSLGQVVVLDRAIKADTQLAGGRTRAAILALILVFAFAIGSAFVVESLDPRIRRAEEIEELYGMPVVARFGGKV
jgi:capsular polysaccharide biosynthesis protein